MQHLMFTANYRDGDVTDGMVVDMLWGALKASGAKVVNTMVHKFYPRGITAVAVLTESHASIHSWPENGFAKVDYFSCSKDPKFEEFEDYFFTRGFGVADKIVVNR